MFVYTCVYVYVCVWGEGGGGGLGRGDYTSVHVLAYTSVHLQCHAYPPYILQAFTFLNPNVTDQTGAKFIAINFNLLLPKMAREGIHYNKADVEKVLTREGLGDNSSRYFVHEEFAASEHREVVSFQQVPKKHQTKQQCFCFKHSKLDKDILKSLEEGEKHLYGLYFTSYGPFI